MSDASIHDLRERGGDIVDRVEQGARVTITRSGRPVAELRPLAKKPLPLAVVLDHMANLPPVDAGALRRDTYTVIDQEL